MSRSVKNDCVTSEHVNFWLCTNPLMSLFRVWCGGSFQGSREEDDILWSRRVKSLSLGIPRGSSLHISRRLKHLSLGMPKASPSSSTTLSGSSPETIFLFGHILCALLGASVCFYFCLCLNKLDYIMLVWERDTLRCCIWTHVFLALLLMFMAKVETASLICYMVGIGKCYM